MNGLLAGLQRKMGKFSIPPEIRPLAKSGTGSTRSGSATGVSFSSLLRLSESPQGWAGPVSGVLNGSIANQDRSGGKIIADASIPSSIAIPFQAFTPARFVGIITVNQSQQQSGNLSDGLYRGVESSNWSWLRCVWLQIRSDSQTIAFTTIPV